MEQLLIVQMIQKLGKILFPSGNKPVFSLIENKCLTVNVHRKPNKKPTLIKNKSQTQGSKGIRHDGQYIDVHL